MKLKAFRLNFIFFVVVIALLSCSNEAVNNQENTQPPIEDHLTEEHLIEEQLVGQLEETIFSGHIYLYGEIHGKSVIIDKEFELWYDYYHTQNMRHLFIEKPYYTAEYLNVWMQADDDDILEDLYSDWAGTQAQNVHTQAFYKKIKDQCPDTVFHGTDVGHQYETTGQKFLSYLILNDLEDSHQYRRTIENINQGKYYYKYNDADYRENKMVENFIQAIAPLEGESVMGIYGAAHVGLDSLSFSKTVANMANQLNDYYPDLISSEDLSVLVRSELPRSEPIEIDDTVYEAQYFGKEKISGFLDYEYIEYWCLDNGYDVFKNMPVWGNMASNFYPMTLEKNQVYIMNFIKQDGSEERVYSRTTDHDQGSSFVFTLETLDKLNVPIKEEKMIIANREYTTSYYGKRDMAGILTLDTIDYWLIEYANEDFTDLEFSDEYLPSSAFPFNIREEQIIMIEMKMVDGQVHRKFFRAISDELTQALVLEY